MKFKKNYHLYLKQKVLLNEISYTDVVEATNLKRTTVSKIFYRGGKKEHVEKICNFLNIPLSDITLTSEEEKQEKLRGRVLVDVEEKVEIPQLLKVIDVAKILNCSYHHVYALSETYKKLPFITIGDKGKRFKVSDVDAFINSGYVIKKRKKRK
jgi:hypothetical protein